MITIADQYYIKALDEYPYNLEFALEHLGYALGYDPGHAGANYLMGRLQMEQFHNYEAAEEYFQIALSNDPQHVKTCEKYIQLFIHKKEYVKAKKLIRYTYKLPHAVLAHILHLDALLNEHQKNYEKAILLLIQAMEENFDNDFSSYLEKELERVEAKESKKRKIKYTIG